MTRVHVIGTGLVGTSLGMALTRAGFAVSLADASPTAVALAADLGAGQVGDPSAPDLVVVATPPDVAGDVVAEALSRWPIATVTDVASFKVAVLRRLHRLGADLSRYVGSHPMAGRERSGAVAARADLFDGRVWVLCPSPDSRPGATDLVRRAAEQVGASVQVLSAQEHDNAVAAVSHVPQIAASAVASRLADLAEESVALAGPGVRDVTRIAESDPRLWTQILAGNAPAVRAVLADLVSDLQGVLAALGDLEQEDPERAEPAPGARGVLAAHLVAGAEGVARIPGKHGAAPATYASVRVLVPDEPGQLGRLFHDVGEAGVNLEDLRLEHGIGQPFGIADIMVVPAAAAHLRAELQERRWRIHD